MNQPMNNAPNPASIEALIRALQARTDRHGELIDCLLIPQALLRESWQAYQRARQQQYDGAAYRLDLFGADDQEVLIPQEAESFATRAYRAWGDHLRQRAHDPRTAQRIGLDQAWIQALCQLLFASSERLGLEKRLRQALAPCAEHADAAITRASLELNEFVTWLGYKDVAPVYRPCSRICREQGIFASPRQTGALQPLTQLAGTPVHSNIAYIGDWLVGLYTRALEQEQAGGAMRADHNADN